MNLIHKKTKKNNFRKREGGQILSEESPFIYTESYKSLRTNLSFVSINNSYKKILVTSALPEEGKSIVAINLAITLAQNGSRVLLMNCDLRKPALGRYLNYNERSQKGLTSILSGDIGLEDGIYRRDDLDFDVISSGALPPNPAELLGSQQMGALMEALGERYNYIICDTPPASLMTDAAVLCGFCDGLLLVIKHKYSSLYQVMSAKKNLESAGANIIGTVLTQFKAEKSGTNQYYYSGYRYGYHQKVSSK